MAFGIVLLVFLAGLPPREPALGEHLSQLVKKSLTTDDEAGEGEGRMLYEKRGVLSTATVGDEGAYGFSLLLCSSGPLEFQERVLRSLREAGGRVPRDATEYCAAQVKTQVAKQRVTAPSNPGLRDQINALAESDQAVRQSQGFDMARMQRVDAEHTAPLQKILKDRGVPGYSMVGPEAAGKFAVMIQHQPAEFRKVALPKLKRLVGQGEADPGLYAMMYDRAQRDAGLPQFYGEAMECENGGPLHPAPMLDPLHVNQRRAKLGLMRVELYRQVVVAVSPPVCGGH